MLCSHHVAWVQLEKWRCPLQFGDASRDIDFEICLSDSWVSKLKVDQSCIKCLPCVCSTVPRWSLGRDAIWSELTAGADLGWTLSILCPISEVVVRCCEEECLVLDTVLHFSTGWHQSGTQQQRSIVQCNAMLSASLYYATLYALRKYKTPGWSHWHRCLVHIAEHIF